MIFITNFRINGITECRLASWIKSSEFVQASQSGSENEQKKSAEEINVFRKCVPGVLFLKSTWNLRFILMWMVSIQTTTQNIFNNKINGTPFDVEYVLHDDQYNIRYRRKRHTLVKHWSKFLKVRSHWIWIFFQFFAAFWILY